MSSKFIKNSRIVNQPITYQWLSMATTAYDKEEKKRREDYEKRMKSEKQRIENISLADLSFKDLYTEPFVDLMGMGRIYSGDSFIFQFLAGGEETKQKCLQILNGELIDYKRQNVTHKDGEILVDDYPFILIRGWGSLTGVGSYNLDERWAARIQDSLAEYIVDKLNNKNYESEN